MFGPGLPLDFSHDLVLPRGTLRLRRVGALLGDQCKRGFLTSFTHVGMLLLEGLREKSVAF
jgi:hypothetical protein